MSAKPPTADAPDRATTDSPADAPELSYEEARTELARVVEKLESGGGTLEESLALWERGEHLAEVCQRWLDGARARLESVRQARSARDTPDA